MKISKYPDDVGYSQPRGPPPGSLSAPTPGPATPTCNDFLKITLFLFFFRNMEYIIYGISFPLPSGPELPISHADPFKATDTNKCCDDFERGERSLVRS